MMNLYGVLKFLHVLSVVLWIGGVTALWITTLRLARTGVEPEAQSPRRSAREPLRRQAVFARNCLMFASMRSAISRSCCSVRSVFRASCNMNSSCATFSDT